MEMKKKSNASCATSVSENNIGMNNWGKLNDGPGFVQCILNFIKGEKNKTHVDSNDL